MPSAFEQEIDKNQAACKTLATAITTLAAGVKTHAGNYDNACNMFYASEDQIKELKEKVKKDAKAAPELKKWQDNHPKIGARVKTEHAEVEKLRAGVAQAKKSAATVRGTYVKLNQGAAKAAVTDVKAVQTDLKGMETQLAAADKEIKRLDTVLTQCMPYPKTIS